MKSQEIWARIDPAEFQGIFYDLLCEIAGEDG
jgi:hypothetical protein